MKLIRLSGFTMCELNQLPLIEQLIAFHSMNLVEELLQEGKLLVGVAHIKRESAGQGC